MENYDDHPFIKYELVDKQTGKTVEIDIDALIQVVDSLSYIHQTWINDSDFNDLNRIQELLRTTNNNLKTVQGAIQTFAFGFSNVLKKTKV